MSLGSAVSRNPAEWAALWVHLWAFLFGLRRSDAALFACVRARSRASCATNRSAVGALMPMIYGANDPNKGTNCPNKGANNPNKGHCAAKH